MPRIYNRMPVTDPEESVLAASLTAMTLIVVAILSLIYGDTSIALALFAMAGILLILVVIIVIVFKL